MDRCLAGAPGTHKAFAALPNVGNQQCLPVEPRRLHPAENRGDDVSSQIIQPDQKRELCRAATHDLCQRIEVQLAIS